MKTLLKQAILLTLLVSLTGCIIANGPLDYASSAESKKVRYLPIGIPYLFGGHGSSVPIHKNFSLTAKHVAQIDYSRVVAYHPHCDIAIIRQNNQHQELASLGSLTQQQALITLGWGLLGRVVKGAGKYYTDVTLENTQYFDICPASITDASLQSGMSGGGVFDQHNALVGIIVGIGRDFHLYTPVKLDTQKISVFVSIDYLKDWIAQSIKAEQMSITAKTTP